jgi:hypothetical protein
VTCLKPFLIENASGVSIVVILKKTVHLSHHLRILPMTLPRTQRARQHQCFGRAATEAHVEADLVALSDRDVLDQQPDHAFALAVRRPRIIPQPRKVGCQGEDLLSLGWADSALVGLALPFAILLRFRQDPGAGDYRRVVSAVPSHAITASTSDQKRSIRFAATAGAIEATGGGCGARIAGGDTGGAIAD